MLGKLEKGFLRQDGVSFKILYFCQSSHLILLSLLSQIFMTYVVFLKVMKMNASMDEECGVIKPNPIPSAANFVSWKDSIVFNTL